MAPPALSRLREAFRPPQSFGGLPPLEGLPAVGGGPPSTEGPPDTAWAEPRPGRLRLDPGLPGVRVLALVGVLAALVAGVWLWWSRPRPQRPPAPVLSPAARPAAIPETSATPTALSLVVDVVGKVRHPGVVTLPAGARVIDALKEAGGLRPGAKTGTLNLARRVVDGEQILVGVSATPDPATAPSAAPGTTPTIAPLDLNTATATQLDQLPGVGPVLAQRIVDYRTQHGGFRSVDELRQVSGIGEAKFADMKNLVHI
jgi:competence protein ComEA